MTAPAREQIARIRARHPGFAEAVLADARITAAHRGERFEFRSRLDAALQIVRLAWQADAFGAQMIYRLKARLQALGVPLVPRLLHRMAISTGQIQIGDPVVVQPGVYLVHGQVVIDGLAEIGTGAVISPFTTIGLLQGRFEGPRLDEDVFVGTGAKVLGAVRVGAGARIGANAVVVDDVAAGETVVGAPARPARRGREPGVHAGPLEHGFAEFFAGLRQTRSQRYASWSPGTGSQRRRAVLTMVHDEPVFLPIWLGYYRRFYAAEDIYVLDNETADGSTSGDGFVRIAVEHDRVDHEWMVSTIEDHQHELLERYDSVLTTDVDEIVAPDPSWGDLGDYLDRFDEEFVNCLGYELLHLPDREPPFDPQRPVLSQRAHWFASTGYDKPALASAPSRWRPGFHALEDGRINLDPDLRMIHLHRMDLEICRQRHAHRSERRWNERDREAGWADHNRLFEAGFERWFFEGSCFGDDEAEIRVELIPPHWRGLF